MSSLLPLFFLKCAQNLRSNRSNKAFWDQMFLQFWDIYLKYTAVVNTLPKKRDLKVLETPLQQRKLHGGPVGLWVVMNAWYRLIPPLLYGNSPICESMIWELLWIFLMIWFVLIKLIFYMLWLEDNSSLASLSFRELWVAGVEKLLVKVARQTILGNVY